jgi:cyclophilin family peptidyl-prolyl cis-trans isomerase/HEAT repeat protein
MKRIVSILFLLGVLSALSGCCKCGEKNIFHDEMMQMIYTLQDNRDTQTLVPVLKDRHPGHRKAAALALASVQDKAAIQPLATLLGDNNIEVRSACAYALGQIGDPEAEPLLIKALDKEESAQVKGYILEALGKCGTDQGLAFLISLDLSKGEELLRVGQTRGIYRYSLRDKVLDQGTEKILDLLEKNDSPDITITAGNYLARLKGIDLTPHYRRLLALAQQKTCIFTRANLALALGKAQHPDVPVFLKTLLAKPHDYRIQVNTVRALENFPYADVKDAVFTALANDNPHVAFQAAEYFKAKGTEVDAPLYRQAAEKIADFRARAGMWAAALKYAPKDNRNGVIDAIVSAYRQTALIYEKASLLAALAEAPSAHAFVAEQAFSSSEKVIQSQAIATLVEMRRILGSQIEPKEEQVFAGYFKQAIASGDGAMIGLCAGILHDPGLGFKTIYKDASFLKAALAGIKLPMDIEAYQELQETMAFFYKEEASLPPTAAQKRKKTADWQKVAAIAPDQKVLVKTTRGDITLRLLVNDSPLSVANFLELVESGYYRNHIFHRVVPNFVIQVGCPRGDGWGGADFTIGSEFGLVYYGEGSVGMASAGKDTESNQWFITHSPTPHLDGRYTIFGRVTSGMEVVHKIGLGDRILDITRL